MCSTNLACTGDGILPANVLDSLSAVEAANALGRAFDIDLPVTLVFDYPSVPSMAAYIFDVLQANHQNGGSLSSPGRALVETPNTCVHYNLADEESPLVTAHLSSRLPTGSTSHCHMPSGRDIVELVPFGRWDLSPRQVYPVAEVVFSMSAHAQSQVTECLDHA